jgi:uncharacterized membrane protein
VKNPLRTEAEAFSFVLVAAVCFLALALAAVFGGRWVGIAVFLALVLGIAVGVYLKTEPKVREPAVWERRAPDGRRRLLVLADEALGGRALYEEIVYRADSATEVLVVAPGLDATSREWDEAKDEARADAGRRVEEAVEALRAKGIEARGTVGDIDPLRAVGEALRTFPADELIVATSGPGGAGEIDVASARERWPVPVTHVVVVLERERHRV